MRENALQAKVLERLRRVGGYWENQSPSAWDDDGRPDIGGCFYSRAVYIELKKPGEYKNLEDGLSDAQKLKKLQIERAGGIYIIADSWEPIARTLHQIFPHIEALAADAGEKRIPTWG